MTEEKVQEIEKYGLGGDDLSELIQALRKSRKREKFLEEQLRKLIARAEVFTKFILNSLSRKEAP